MLASGSIDSTIRLWNKNTGSLLKNLYGHNKLINSVSFDSNDILASCAWDKNIKLWNKHTGILLKTLTGHDGMVNSVAFDNNDMLASSDDYTIKLWGK
jgi:WD40 repeat protein